jgi:hypothetical protein
MTLNPSSALAQAGQEEDGEHHLKAAWKELEAQEWERAIQSATAVRRLNPSDHSALLIWAVAYEGKGMLRKSQSYLLTYQELLQGLDLHPEAASLQARLEDALSEAIGPSSWQPGAPQPKRAEIEQVEVSVTRRAGAFGDGYVLIGVLAGGRAFGQRPCSGDGACFAEGETRPGLWAYEAQGFGGGLSVRAEYFFARKYIGARLRFDLAQSQPVDHHGLGRPPADVNYRLDLHIVGRIPLSQGRVGVQLLADVAYGMRSFDVLGNVSTTEATVWTFLANQVGGGLGLRIEPARRVGVEARGGAAILLKPSGGLTEVQAEVALVLRPVPLLAVRLAGDFRRSTWIFEQDGATTEVRDLVAGLWAGLGLTF